MGAPFQPISEWVFTEGYRSALIRGTGGDFMAQGSENAMITGAGRVRASNHPLLINGKVGSRLFFHDNQSYAGLGTGTVNGAGSIFNVKTLLHFIGSGQVNFNGAALAGVVASSTLSFLQRSGATYGTTVLQAGHAQPTAPTIYAKDNPSAGKTQMTGAVVVYIWRVCSITGQVSLASLASNILTLSGQDVIVQFPAADNNGQDIWGIGVVKIGFEELGVGYTLPISLGGEIAEDDLTTIDGIDRACEISWSNGDLYNSELIPDRAFPPVAGSFAGVINDCLWLDADGIIYIGDPGYNGSFPPKNAVFAPEDAVAYLPTHRGVTIRFGKTRIGLLYYVGGSPAIEYQTVIENQGILLPQNAFLGYNGRICAWLGKPTVINFNPSTNEFEPDFDYAKDIEEFATEAWGANQTAAKPIVGFYDAIGQYECWCFGTKIIARHGPSGRWCAPEDVTDSVTGDIMAGVTVNVLGAGHPAYFSAVDGVTLSLYQYDAGTGSVMKVHTSTLSRMNYSGDVTMIMSEGRADNIINPVRLQLVVDGDSDNALADPLEGEPEQTPTDTGWQSFTLREPNGIDAARKHSVLFTLTSAGGDAGPERIATFGSTDEMEIR